MPRKKYIINLSDEEHQELEEMTHKGKIGVRKFKRAMILLKANEGLSDPQIMAALDVSRPTVERIRKRFIEGGPEKALNEDPRPGQKRKLDGRGEAVLLATACSKVPDGYEHWTLRLLAGKMVELKVVDEISHETIRQTLKKTRSSPGKRKCGASRRPVPNM